VTSVILNEYNAIKSCRSTFFGPGPADGETSISQFYASAKNKSVIPARVGQKIKVARVEFAAIDCWIIQNNEWCWF